MALDHALARTLEEGCGVVRLYRWSGPTVSFGRNEPARGRYDTDRARAEGIRFVRRPTGGRAVLHDAELTYAVVAPLRAFGGLRGAYLRINQGLVEGLRTLGADVAVAGEGEVLPPDAGPCFRLPAPGEVVAGGRKLVGSAQARVEGALLQHGSLILSGDQSRLARLAGPARERAEPPATLEGLVGSISVEAAAGAVARGLRLALGGRWAEAGYRALEERAADALVEERYGREDWTWRR